MRAGPQFQGRAAGVLDLQRRLRVLGCPCRIEDKQLADWPSYVNVQEEQCDFTCEI